MKSIISGIFAIAFITFFASCQSASSQIAALSNNESRKEIIDSIANDSLMSKEMMGAMMNSKTGMMVMQQHAMMMMESQNSMMEMSKNNPGMMNNMMSAMMETAKGDSSMMSGMIKTMMGNPQMMEMMQKMTGNKGKMGMDHMGGMGK